MVNPLITFAFLALGTSAWSQFAEVKFREEALANGMLYPQVIIAANKAHQDSVNADIQRHIAEFKSSDFCIGEYGYVQKSTHLQIHIFCNCVDYETGQNRYLLYNLEEGRGVPYSDLLNPKEKKAATEFLMTRIQSFSAAHALSLSEEQLELIRQKNLDAFQCEMNKDGIRLTWPDGSWGNTSCAVAWSELKPFLKYHFM